MYTKCNQCCCKAKCKFINFKKKRCYCTREKNTKHICSNICGTKGCSLLDFHLGNCLLSNIDTFTRHEESILKNIKQISIIQFHKKIKPPKNKCNAKICSNSLGHTCLGKRSSLARKNKKIFHLVCYNFYNNY